MYSSLRKGLFAVTFSGAVMCSMMTAYAGGPQSVLPSVGIEEVLNDCYASDKEVDIEEYLVPTEKGEYLDMAFADVETFLYVRSEPTKQSEWVGKLYSGDAATILGPVGEWTKVKSGSVIGYVYSKYITVGKRAEEKAQKIVKEKKGKDPKQDFTQIFQYAESKEEEIERLEQEAEKRVEEIAKEQAGSGQDVVDYACQFIGNPYVWGGTSLTNGADCSGFVQSVYKHFGVNLPRTSGEMRGAGTGVSYDEAIPGDIICYDGHVGIYMGDGQIVNAINSSKGIGILSATYANIITVRRVL